MNILISGGAGLVGRHLCKKLQEKGYSVSILSRKRRKNANVTTYLWDPENNEIEIESLLNTDFIIHLAGENIGDKRWTVHRKQLIVDSRVKSAELLFNTIKNMSDKPMAFISASAVGFYGTRTTTKIYTENDLPSNDFLGETCKLWERCADNFKELGLRTVKIRTGLVLSRHGGPISMIQRLFKLGLGSAIGSGQQYITWIHIDDLCEIYVRAIENSNFTGVYNAVAPECPTNKEFGKQLAHVLRKPYWLPNIPGFILKFLFGQRSEIFLQGSRVSSNKIMSEGFTFKFPTLQMAFTDLFIKKERFIPTNLE